MTTVTANPCPRCEGELRTGSDHYGGYLHCLCGYYLDDAGPEVEGDDGIPYIGTHRPYVGRTAQFKEIRSPTGYYIQMRVLFRPKIYQGAACSIEMTKTKVVHEVQVYRTYNTGTVKNGTRRLKEYRCGRGHRVGINSSWSGWQDCPPVVSHLKKIDI